MLSFFLSLGAALAATTTSVDPNAAVERAVAAAPIVAPVAASEAPRQATFQFTMATAVAQALRTHPQILAGQQGVLAAHYGKWANLGAMLPRVAVSDQQIWSHVNPHDLPARLLPEQSAGLGALNARSNLLGINVGQPLMGLIGQSQRYRASVADKQAASAQLMAARRAIDLEVRRQYLAVFEARALADTAEASERALREQVEDAEHKLAAGALATTDVLRRRAAAASAKQQTLAATANEQAARSALLELLGLGESGPEVSFVPPDVAGEAPSPTELAALRQGALQQRPELVQLAAQAHASRLRARAEQLKLLPEIDAQLAWMHVFADAGNDRRGHIDAYYVGLAVRWPIWQWGSTFNAGRAARAQAAGAVAQKQAAERRVGTELAERHAHYLACLGAVGASLAEASSAEEAYRVMVATLAVDAATTSDLLQTEAAQTQARMNLVRARYQLALAKIALDHAAGLEG